MPILLLLLLGIIEGARIVWAYITVQQAAREAARFAVTGGPLDVNGDPWTGTDVERFQAIITKAITSSAGLNIQVLGTQSFTGTSGTANCPTSRTFQDCQDYPSALGVAVRGQYGPSTDDRRWDYGGVPGADVEVFVYYNVEMLDPIFQALIPGGFLHVQGEVLMKNEGIDSTVGSIPPAPPPPTPTLPSNPGSNPGPGPDLEIQNPQDTYEAGSTITVNLLNHKASSLYNLYLDGVLMVSNIPTNASGFGQATFQIPVDTLPGEHTIYSLLADSTGPQTVEPIMVVSSTTARVTVNNLETGSKLPPNQCVTIALYAHTANTTYTVVTTPTLSSSPAPQTTDGSGNAVPGSPNYVIPSGAGAGLYLISSVSPNPPNPTVASGSFEVTSPSLLVQGGNTWPAGTNIAAFIQQHAPGRTYSLYFDGSQVDSAKIANPSGQQNYSFAIPIGMANGTYALESRDECGNVIKQTSITVNTPSGPFIVVPGGTTWPAGSPIDIQIRKHAANTFYDVYFDSTLIGTVQTDASGDNSSIQDFVIPVSTSQGLHKIRTEPAGGGATVAELNIDVLPVPYLEIAGGNTWQPGQTITVTLKQHAANNVYEIHLGGNFLLEITTDGSGEASFQYTIPPNTISGTYPIVSRQGTTDIATVDLVVVASDLRVTNIELPPNPVFNEPQPITITIRNDSSIDLTGRLFDVDIYVDPMIPPTVSASLPPGDYKQWLSGINANSTATIYEDITLFGTGEHSLYARVDTSDFVVETNETNNILSDILSTSACALEVEDDFDDGVVDGAWTKTDFGNGSPSSVSESGGTLTLNSQGSSTWVRNDRNGGFTFLHQQVSSDFDMRVRVLDIPGLNQWSKAGLEVRESLGNSAPKIDLALTRDHGIQAGWRNGGGMDRPPSPYNNDAPAGAPVWLRITREGDVFSYYYATTAGQDPPANTDWIFRGSKEVPMSDPVYVGLFNASYHGNQNDSATFDNFHVCVDPASPESCGEVRESGGQVVISAKNFVGNLQRSGHDWTSTSQNGLIGMQATPDNGMNNNTNYDSSSPELQYQVKFTTTGTYYVWILGWGPNTNGDSVHVGLNGTPNASSDRITGFPTGSSAPGWSNGTMDGPPATISVGSPGSQTINVWMREDGFKMFKILLTTDPGFTPSGTDQEQSVCTSTGTSPGDLPPGLQICSADFQQQGFEGTASEVAAVWPNAGILEGTNIHNTIKQEGNFGALLSTFAGGQRRHPWMYQEFVMPDLILTDTVGTLSLHKGIYNQGDTTTSDPFYFVLRDTNGITLTTPITLALSNDAPQLNPSNPQASDWVPFATTDVLTAMLTAGNNPADYAGQTLQAFFYGPNTAPPAIPSHANLYLDNINLKVCTVVPEPETQPGTGKFGGIVRVPAEGTLVPKSGVSVWAYAVNGPLFKTYSVQGGKYGFYNVPPGAYIVYTQYQVGSTVYQKTLFITVTPDMDDFTFDLNLVVAGG